MKRLTKLWTRCWPAAMHSPVTETQPSATTSSVTPSSIVFSSVASSSALAYPNEYAAVHAVQLAISLAQPIAQSCQLQIAAGEIVGLLGGSGCGKTSLLQALAGFLPAKGQFAIAGQLQLNLPAYQRALGYVQQQPTLFSHWTVAQHIAQVQQRAWQPIDLAPLLVGLGIEPLLNSYPAALSGGQRQRVAVLLALVKGAPLLLLDECFTGLDALSKQRCLATLADYCQRYQVAAMVTSHQLSDIAQLARRVLVAVPASSVAEPSTVSSTAVAMTWQLHEVAQGLAVYQQQLRQHSEDSNTASQADHEFSQVDLTSILGQSLLRFTVLPVQPHQGLTALALDAQIAFCHRLPSADAGQTVVALVNSQQFGVSRRLLSDSSFVNQWAVQLLSLTVQQQGWLLHCQLQHSTQTVQVWLSDFSKQKLQLAVGDELYLLAKADAVQPLACYQQP